MKKSFEFLFGECMKVSKLYSIYLILDRVFISLFPLVRVYFVTMIVSSVSRTNIDRTELIRLVIVFVILEMLYNMRNFFVYYVVVKFKAKARVLDKDIVKQKSSLLYKYYENSEMMELIHRVTSNYGNDIVTKFNKLLSFFAVVAKGIVILLIISRSSVWIGAVLLLCVIPLVIVSIKTGNKKYDSYKYVTQYNRNEKYFNDVLTTREYASERNVFQNANFFLQQCQEKFEESLSKFCKIEKMNNVYSGISVAFVCCISILSARLLYFGVSNGSISVAEYIGIVSTIILFVSEISYTFTGVVEDVTNIMLYGKDIEVWNNLEYDNEYLDNAVKIDTVDNVNKIEFVNVSFGYDGSDKKVLDNVSFELNANKKYALVGLNGAGKSTILNLLLGLYDNYTGDILVSGVNIKNIEMKKRKSLFAIVFQNFGTYNLTLEENLSLGNPYGVEESEIKNYENKLGISRSQNLGKLEDDYRQLSMGQWQSLSVKRNVLRKPEVLVLDEPTASLDPIAERKFYEDEVGNINTSIVIFVTHRMGATTSADEIIFVENGSVKEVGSHDELMNIKGRYHNLYESQRGLYAYE